jgi:hypothetical protein
MLAVIVSQLDGKKHWEKRPPGCAHLSSMWTRSMLTQAERLSVKQVCMETSTLLKALSLSGNMNTKPGNSIQSSTVFYWALCLLQEASKTGQQGGCNSANRVIIFLNLNCCKNASVLILLILLSSIWKSVREGQIFVNLLPSNN